MKQLPIGISTLEKIRAENYSYANKTHHVDKLASDGGCYYFLSLRVVLVNRYCWIQLNKPS